MKTTKKLNCCYSVNVDEETAQLIEKIAELEQRKPRELLRLLLKPALINRYAEIQKQEHQENNEPPTVAKFQA